ncbi:MFS transporter, partial [Enhygromyxa salina]|uniref:MFS transporter n=1 Tax=Enhygromyxa salina TaxID=215803 RepID=UPI0011BA6CCF
MHASATMVALLSTAFSAAQFVMSPVLGGISGRYGRRPVMLVSIAGSVVAALVLGFAHALRIVFLARIVAGSSAVFGEQVFGWGYGETGLFMTYIGVNMVVFQGLIVGRAVARLGEGATLSIGLVMVAGALMLLGGVDHFSQWLGFALVDADGAASVAALGFYAVGGLLLAGGNGFTSATT